MLTARGLMATSPARRPRLRSWGRPDGRPTNASEDGQERCRNFRGMDSLGLDTIAGAKLLQVKFGAAAAFQPDQAVMHEDRRARFIGARDSVAIIRYSADRNPIAVPLEALSLPAEEQDYSEAPAHARADARQAGAAPHRSRLVVRPEMGRLSRHHPQRRAGLRP